MHYKIPVRITSKFKLLITGSNFVIGFCPLLLPRQPLATLRRGFSLPSGERRNDFSGTSHFSPNFRSDPHTLVQNATISSRLVRFRKAALTVHNGTETPQVDPPVARRCEIDQE
jgi:hypothetical protein